jgi:DNA mismatch repair ATPase MutS
MDQIQVAKGISELGMLVMAGAFFLVLSATMMAVVVKLFSKMINNTMEENKATQNKLIEAINEQSAQLVDVAEGLREKTLNEIKIVSGALFDNGKSEITKIIKTIRQENHIQNKKATIAKIRKMVINVHENRNSKFDAFKFRGKSLASYTSPEWIEQLSQVVEQEVYSDSVNNGRADTNITNITESMKLDFYHNLINGAA